MTVNRTQALVLGFFVVVVLSVVVIRLAVPAVYEQAMGVPADNRVLVLAFPVALGCLLVLLGMGVLWRWRWMFWLVLAAFLAGVLRVPAAALQLAGVLAADVPGWYVVLQGLIGLLQCGIGVLMVRGYRRAGVWGAF